MDLTTCNLGKFLVVPTFVAKRLQVRLDARAPSGESWNYLLSTYFLSDLIIGLYITCT